MNGNDLTTMMGRFNGLIIGVIGDFCLDAYWLLDQTQVELSVETGKPTNAICKQSYSLGGAGNVLNNLRDLGVGDVYAFGVTGDDVFGREMLELMHRSRINTEGMMVQKEGWDTCVYAKPYIDLNEKERIDFGRFNKFVNATADRVLAQLERILPSLDGLIINQQLRRGIHSEYFIKKLQVIIKKHSEKTILLDARNVSNQYHHVICKLNACEAARVCGPDREINQAIPPEELAGYAKTIHQQTQRPVVITRGDRGMLAYDGKTITEVPGILIIEPIDTVGAGDTTAITKPFCFGQQ